MGAYQAGGIAGRFNAAFNPVTRAFDHIATLAQSPDTFAVNLERSYPGTEFTPDMVKR